MKRVNVARGHHTRDRGLVIIIIIFESSFCALRTQRDTRVTKALAHKVFSLREPGGLSMVALPVQVAQPHDNIINRVARGVCFGGHKHTIDSHIHWHEPRRNSPGYSLLNRQSCVILVAFDLQVPQNLCDLAAPLQ